MSTRPPVVHRRGQTLAEFAITLPLLLLLVFGTIEFARVFQSWVTLQNAARSAARFASIGAIKYDLFTIPNGTGPRDERVLNTIVPCIGSDDPGGSDQRGNPATLNGVDILEGGRESLFATWYDGTDCDPGNEDHLQYRRDILRLISIMHEARDSVNSLGVEPNEYVNLGQDGVRNILYDTWSLPYPGNHESAGYFSVSVCSARPVIDPVSQRLNPFFDSRFMMIRTESERPADPALIDYPLPYCLLNEKPPEFIGSTRRDRVLDNSGARWNDAGGPGDRVTVLVRYNHPLITPISREPYITMEARRSAVNESFRAPKAIRALQLPGYISTDPEDAGQVPATNTPTNTPEDTPEETPSATPTNTDVPPFACEKLGVSWSDSPFVGTDFYMSIRNDNPAATRLYGVELSWGTAAAPPLPDFPNMYMGSAALDTVVHWIGSRPSGTQYNVSFDRTSPQWLADAYDYIAANDTSIWSGQFINGPSNLGAYLNLWNFDGTFRFINPDNNELCVIPFTRPERPPATDTPVPTAGPSPTPTPNCATVEDIQLLRGGYDTFDGTYYFEFRNRAGSPAEIIGIDFVWPDARHPQITYPYPNKYYLASVVIGEAVSSPDAQVIWQGNDNSGNTSINAPYQRATRAGFWGGANVSNAAEGQWLRVGIIPPNTTVRIHLNFDGTGANDMRVFGVRDHHFHFPRLNIGCTRGGSGGNGGGGGNEGEITLPIPSPTNTFTPAPTATQGPTNTPSNTSPPPTATPRRPTNTPTLVPTQPPATFTPTRPPLGYTPPPTNRPGE